MFLKEALWIKESLEMLDLKSGQRVLDVGSSSEKYRCLQQPYIDYYVFRPLREKGLSIKYLDGKSDDGIDIVCDLTSVDADSLVNEIEPVDVAICASLLEHVVDRNLVVERLKKIIKRGGVLILTVPHVLRYHPDPIDTMYRPSNIELEALFPKEEYYEEYYTVIESTLIETDELATVIQERHSIFVRIINRFLREMNLRTIPDKPRIIIPNKIAALVIKKS